MGIATVALALVPAVSQASTWQIDPDNSHVGFSAKHMLVSTVRGGFAKYSGTLELDDNDLTKSSISVTIDAASIATNVAKRDEHLRSADFLDVAKFPQITFKSTSIKKAGAGYKVTGDLTMRGVTKPVTLDVTDVSPVVANPWGGMNRGFSATGRINRMDFGVSWNTTVGKTGLLVGQEVTIDIEVEAKKK
jgi:polyisoprenoid-binding protein YceI